jgi:GNAT superfamily N-acetyltransferase
MTFTFSSLTRGNWDDLVALFGDKGACGGCWCMYWRSKASDYNRLKGEGNKKAFRKLAMKTSPGIIAYADGQTAGWCAVAPRSEYVRLEKSRVLKPVDDQPVWSISCFFIHKEFRNKGLSKQLLSSAVDFAVSNGAKIVEGYPVELKTGKMPDVFAWTGFSKTFIKAGFKEVERRSEGRPIMRYFKI